MNSYVTNYHLYAQIRAEQKDFNPDIAKIVDNIGHYRQAVDLSEQLKIVGAALDKLQADKTSLSNAFKI